MDKPILAAILSCSGTALTDEEKRLFAAKNPLGISLFMRNIQNASQLKNLIKEINYLSITPSQFSHLVLISYNSFLISLSVSFLE